MAWDDDDEILCGSQAISFDDGLYLLNLNAKSLIAEIEKPKYVNSFTYVKLPAT